MNPRCSAVSDLLQTGKPALRKRSQLIAVLRLANHSGPLLNLRLCFHPSDLRIIVNNLLCDNL